MKIRTVFMGSPEFSLPMLRKLAENTNLIGVVTQPDRPSGRGKSLTSPPVKLLAIGLGIDYIQPERLRDPEAMQHLREWNPELIIVAAFGKILRSEVLKLPPFGCINVHASLLPRWRGASPIQAAILAGDSKTGISIMLMDEELDTGPILNQQEIPIFPDDNSGSLNDRLALLGASLLIKTLPDYIGGRITPIPQSQFTHEPTYAPVLKKEDGLLNFSQPAEALSRRVRAFYPWPGTYMQWQGQILKIHQAHAVESVVSEPGKTLVLQKSPAVTTGNGLLILDGVQPTGKKQMRGQDFLHGARGWGQELSLK